MPNDPSPAHRTKSPPTVPPQFACAWTRDGPGSASVHPVGELDHANLAEFREALREAQAGATLVCVDLRELTFIDCGGLGAIVEARKGARRHGGSLTLVRGSGQVLRMLELTGLPEEIERVKAEPAIRSLGLGAGPTDAAASAMPPVQLQPPATQPVLFRRVG